MAESTPPVPNPQIRRRRKKGGAFIPNSFIESAAFRELTRHKHGYAIEFLFIVLSRRVYANGTKIGDKPSLTFGVTNNGNIQFTYKEASEKYGFSVSTFRDSIDKNMKIGCLDIAKPSKLGTNNNDTLTTKFTISDRWQKYGTPDFKEKWRPKATVRKGRKWKKGESGREYQNGR